MAKAPKSSLLSISRIWTIATGTFTQLVRMKVFYFLAVFALLIIGIHFIEDALCDHLFHRLHGLTHPPRSRRAHALYHPLETRSSSRLSPRETYWRHLSHRRLPSRDGWFDVPDALDQNPASHR